MNAPQPPPTNPEIFKNGTAIYCLSGPRSQTIEDWVVTLAKLTGLTMFCMIVRTLLICSLFHAVDDREEGVDLAPRVRAAFTSPDSVS